MKNSILLICFLCFGKVFAQNIEIINLKQLQQQYYQENDTTYILNFFATWCGPCRAEIPIFNKFYSSNKNPKIKFLYISLDDKSTVKKVLPKFITKNKITAPVFVLDESKDFSWLPLVDKKWQGSIPATLIINSKRKQKLFIEQAFDKGQMEYYLKKMNLLEK